MSNRRGGMAVAAVWAAIILLVAGCGNVGAPPARLGMVKDPDSGMMFGSVVSGSFVTDSSFHKNKKIKVRVRNTSGDPNFDLNRFTRQIEDAYAAAGYQPTSDDDFGLMINVNVRYSGQIQNNLATEFGFLGAAAGGIAGYRSDAKAGTAIGVVGGATLGSILGSFITDDTYIVVTEIAFVIVKEPAKRDGKTIILGSSVLGHPDDVEEREERRSSRSIKSSSRIEAAAFAGGRNVRQGEIAEQVRQRFVRIIKDAI